MPNKRRAGKKYKRFPSSTSDDTDIPTAEFGNPQRTHVHEMEVATQLQFTQIMERLVKLDMLDDINNRLANMETELVTMRDKITNLEDASEFASANIEALKVEKLDKSEFSKLEEKYEDLANRARRNNLIFLNIPEGNEGAQDSGNQYDKCKELIQTILCDNLLVNGDDMSIERAHRTPTHLTTPRNRPRPIHVAFLSYFDRQRVLLAAKNLKTNPYPEENAKYKLIISEDVTPKLQEERRKLSKLRKTMLQEVPDRKIFINYPAYLRVVEPDGSVRRIETKDIAD